MFIQVLVDNKAKGQISKRVLKENKARQIFPPDTHDVLFSCNTCFEIRPSALLPTY